MIKPKMVLVEEGSFIMGSTEGWKDELPIRQVSLSSFLIGKYPVTQKEWEAVMGENPSHSEGCPDQPVTNVSWYDVQEFLTKLNTLTGLQYRLPTEAEWEYAARGGIQSKGYKYSGSNDLDEVAWYFDNFTVPCPVGQKKPNELGIYDMSGNVDEWCQDWHGKYPSFTQTNPKGPDIGSDRVYRGGSWASYPPLCRVTTRLYNYPGFSSHFLGFRLAHNFDTFKNE